MERCGDHDDGEFFSSSKSSLATQSTESSSPAPEEAYRPATGILSSNGAGIYPFYLALSQENPNLPFQEMCVEVTKIVEGHGEKDAEKTSYKNIFEELIDSDIPPQEKTINRLNQEGFALILAGGDTSSQTLAYISFHLLDNPEILKQLKQELCVAIPDPDFPLKWQELEQLPFLVSC